VRPVAKRLVVTAALTCIVTALAAQSPPPPPTPTEAAHEKQQASDRVNGNRDLLKQVTVLLKKQNESAERQRQKDHDKASSDWWLVGFTGALTFVGIVQLIAMFRQASYMRHGLAETKRAADAAKLSADAATSAGERILVTERAIVLIDNVKALTKGPAFGLEPHSVVIFTLKNFGRTIAHDVKLKGALTGVGNDPLEEMPPTTIAPQGTNSWVSRSIVYWINEETIKKINARGALLKYEIDVTYKDSFHKDHGYRCEGRYEPALKQFLITSSTSD
jgi:hypothetical protein